MTDLERRLELAERVCLMFGWSPAHADTDRGNAAHELWREWLEEFERQGGSPFPKDHPDLSDAVVAELSKRRRDIRAATLAKIDQMVVTEPA